MLKNIHTISVFFLLLTYNVGKVHDMGMREESRTSSRLNLASDSASLVFCTGELGEGVGD